MGFKEIFEKVQAEYKQDLELEKVTGHTSELLERIRKMGC